MLTLNTINGRFSPQRRSSISARPDSKSVSAAEKVTVDGREGKQLTCRGPSGCSTRLSYVILQWISLSLFLSPTALLSHNIEMLHALHDLKHPALIIYQWRHPFPSLPFPTLNLRKSAFAAQVSSILAPHFLPFTALFFFFNDHKALWVHNMTNCGPTLHCSCLACSILAHARQHRCWNSLGHVRAVNRA